MNNKKNDALSLREVMLDDLAVFYAHQLDPQASQMAAFTTENPADRMAFNAHWERILADGHVMVRTIAMDGQVAGHVLSYEVHDRPEVSYWIGKDYWGHGVASRALEEFLRTVNLQRPIYARVAKDNLASRRVLKKCGFVTIGESKGFANARGCEIEELLLELR